EAVLALRTDIRTGEPKQKQAAATTLVKLWMTLVRHRGRAPADKPAAEPELSPFQRFCGNLEKLSDPELRELLDDLRAHDDGIQSKRNRPPPEDGPGESGTPVPRPQGPRPSDGGCSIDPAGVRPSGQPGVSNPGNGTAAPTSDHGPASHLSRSREQPACGRR